MSASTYSADLADEICRRMVEGDDGAPRSLRSVCKDADMPNRATVMRWLNQHEDFRKKYDQARADQMDYFADEVIDISDDGSRDYIEEDDGRGGKRLVADHDHIQRARLRVDSRKWLCGKWAPRRFGDRVTAEHTGANGGPIETKLNDIELVDRLLGLVLSAQQQQQQGG